MEKASWVVNKYNAIEIIPKLKVQNVVVLEPANALGWEDEEEEQMISTGAREIMFPVARILKEARLVRLDETRANVSHTWWNGLKKWNK